MKFTEYGYFGRTQNVKDASIAVDAFAAAIASLPRRERPSADVIPIGRGRAK